MYEISPYATFSVPGNNSRCVTTSTLDYTMQFKTFGHIEDDDHNAIMYAKNPNSKHSWHKHRYYNSEGKSLSRLLPLLNYRHTHHQQPIHKNPVYVRIVSRLEVTQNRTTQVAVHVVIVPALPITASR